MHNRRGMQLALITTVGAWLVVCLSGVGFAQPIQPSALVEIQAILQEKMNRSPIQQKLDSQIHLSGQAARGAVTTSMIPSLPRIVSALKLDEVGNVHVDIQGTVTNGLLAEIAALGGTVESAFPSYGTIRAWMPLLALETLASRPDVTFIMPAAEAMTNTRPIDTKALISHGIDTVLNQGITGSGVKVGVLSDGVKSLATLQAAGNLPAVTVLSGQAGPATADEGTAMLEIVYDLAPGAQLFFATAFNGPASFATNIQNLAAAGATIIVDDVTYFNEGAFQDGIIAQAVNTVTANGVLYFSSAGNSGNLDSGTSGTWEGDFVDSSTSIPVINTAEGKVVKVHAFDATHNYNQVTVASSNGSATTLKWSDPLGASTNDYDLFVLDSTMSTILAQSTNSQTGTQDPYESVSAPPAGSRIVVVLYTGSPRALNLVTNRGRLAIATSGATFGHNAAGAALTVAATPAQSTIFTVGNQSPETYSSDGPRKIFFNPNGTAITAGNFLFSTGGGTTLSKVDFTAADCGQSAVSGFNPFCGTSAAAPTATAIAALIMSAQPGLTASQVATMMKNTALSAHAGFGARTVGSGIVMANVSSPATLSVSPTTVAAGGSVTATWSGIASPTSTDWIGLFVSSGAANTSYLAWIYVSCSQVPGAAAAAGSCAFPIPSNTPAGTTYELRLFSNNGFTRLATSNTFTVTAAGPATTLTASPATIQAGTSVTATWSGIASPTSTDWIGLFASSGAANTSYLAWIYVSCSQVPGAAAAAGSCAFPIPSTTPAGTTYELRLFTNNGYTRLATSNTFTVTAAGGTTTLSASPVSVAAGASVTATWGGIASPTPTDWIGLFVPSAANTSYLAWIYVSCSQAAGSAMAAGSCAFTIPGAITPGTYELRLFSNNGYTRLATSNALTVTAGGGPTVSVSPTSVAAGTSVSATWSGIASPTTTDWIGVFAPGAANTSYLAWIYVSCSQSPGAAAAAGTCPFVIPNGLAVGTYELRLLSNNGYTRLATSNPLSVH